MNFRLSSCNDGHGAGLRRGDDGPAGAGARRKRPGGEPAGGENRRDHLERRYRLHATARRRAAARCGSRFGRRPGESGPMRHGRLQPRLPHRSHGLEELEQPGPAARVPVPAPVRAGTPLHPHRPGAGVDDQPGERRAAPDDPGVAGGSDHRRRGGLPDHRSRGADERGARQRGGDRHPERRAGVCRRQRRRRTTARRSP